MVKFHMDQLHVVQGCGEEEKILSNSVFLMYLLSSRSGVKHCMQLHKSYIGAAAAGLQRLVCLQEQKKKKKSARVTLCIL